MNRSIRIIAQPTQEEIARLAYYFYEESGRQEGHDVEHWMQAQAHLATDSVHSVSVEKTPPGNRDFPAR